jgi:hypothetical protein
VAWCERPQHDNHNHAAFTPMIRKMRWLPPSAFFGTLYESKCGHAVFAWSMKP